MPKEEKGDGLQSYSIREKLLSKPNGKFGFIDKNLPRHVVFVLEYAQKYLLYINYKEWLEKDKGTFRITESFSSAWLTEDALTLPLNGLSLDTVYENFVRHIGASRIDLSCENLQEAVEVTQQREELERQIKVLKKKATHERQPQKKYSLHTKIIELETLIGKH